MVMCRVRCVCGLAETNFMLSADATFLGQTLTIALRLCVFLHATRII